MPRGRAQEPAKPLLLGVIGTGEASAEVLEALLVDLTSPYEEVSFIFPAVGSMWTTSTDVVYDWTGDATDDGLPFDALTGSGAPEKDFVQILESAEQVHKVARIPVKMVQLLQEAQADADVKLLVLWDEKDEDTVLAVNKALELGVPAVDLLNGLEPFEFGDDDTGEGEDPEGDDAERVGAEPAAIGDDYDDLGVRALRAKLREHPNKKLSDRAIGQLDKDDAIRALRIADQDAAGGVGPDKIVEDDEPAAAAKTERTGRARRAFAEGAAEGRGDEAQQELPRSRGGDVLEDQDGELQVAGDPVTEDEAQDVLGQNSQPTMHPVAAAAQEEWLRFEALKLAVQSGAGPEQAVPVAQRYEIYLRGERKAPGRPRADGSPAQLRERDPETGKPVRRRAARGSTD